MAAARSNIQQSSMAAIPVLIGIIGMGAAMWFRYPGMAALWLGITVAAFIEPPALLTGPKVAGRPVPLDESEDARLEKFRFWSTLRSGMFPGKAWMPGWPIQFSWLIGLFAGLTAFNLPVYIPDVEANPIIWNIANAVFAFAAIVGPRYAKRTVVMSPGTTIKDAISNPILAGIGAVVGAVVGAGLAFYVLPKLSAIPALIEQGIVIQDGPILWAGLIGLGVTLGAGLAVRAKALAHWREVYARRKEWTPRWRELKQEPAPFLIDTATVGPFTVDTFESRGAAADILKIGETKIAPAIGAGVKIGFLTAPNIRGGQPVPGTVHPNRFVIATCDADQWPDAGDETVDDEVRLLTARTEWQPRWKSLKADPAPELVNTEIVGPARIDTFVAPSHLGSGFFLPLTSKIVSFVGANARAAILPEWDGSMAHPVNFRVVQWSGLPDISDPTMSTGLLALLLDSQMVWEMERVKMGVPHVIEIQLLNEDDENALWGVDLDFPMGPGWKSMRRDGLASMVAGALRSQALVNHQPGAEAMYLGNVDTEKVPAPLRQKLDELSAEDRWSKTWTAALKQGQLPPTLQHRSVASKKLNDGTVVHRYAFAPLQGRSPMEFFGLEQKLSTSLVPAPFLTTTGWQAPRSRPGERHPQLFTIYHAEKQVPNPTNLQPTPVDRDDESAAKWVLRGIMNFAFAAARRTQPEVIGARCLTPKASRLNIWQVDLRLFGGDTLADIRAVREKLRQSSGVEWLRVAPHEHGVSIFLGADPANVRLADPKRDQSLIDDLNWTQAFIDAGVTSRAGGLLPTLVSSSTMPKNENVKVLEFDLPPGVSLADVRDKIERLKSAVGCVFLSPMAVKDEATRIRVLSAVKDPMPTYVPYDYDEVRSSKHVPFGQGVDGETVEYDFRKAVHALIAGSSGSGKSAALQMLITGALVRGCEVVVADPMKGAADFQFAAPWLRYLTKGEDMAYDIMEAAALMRWVYKQVEERKALNAKYGVGSFADLPEDVRPARMVVVVDEFTSLILSEIVQRTAYDDPEMESERQRVLAINLARSEIGQFAGKIAREARSAGVTMWLGAQKLTSKTLDSIPGGDSLKNSLARLLMGMSTFGERMSALRLPEFAPDLGTEVPIGRGLFESNVAASVAVHTYYDKAENLAAFVDEMGAIKHDFVDMSPYIRKAAEDDIPAVQEVELDLFDAPSNVPAVVDAGFTFDDAAVADDGGMDLSALVTGWTPPSDDGEDDEADPFADFSPEAVSVEEHNPFDAMPQMEVDDTNPFEQFEQADDEAIEDDFINFDVTPVEPEVVAPEPEPVTPPQPEVVVEDEEDWGFDDDEPEPAPTNTLIVNEYHDDVVTLPDEENPPPPPVNNWGSDTW